MRVGAVICEYNPFHRGHAWQLSRLRQEEGCDAVLCLMSGHFTQRGDVAILSKWDRAAAAIHGGADLVLELPTRYALCSAEGFAHHGVAMLASTGVAQILHFGSETGEVQPLLELAHLLLQPDILEAITTLQKSGLGFAAARQQVVAQHCPQLAPLLRQPNNILGVEYCKAILRQKLPLRPVTISRQGAGYHASTPVEGYASASYLRAHWQEPDAAAYLPAFSLELLRRQGDCPSLERLETALLYHLRTLSPGQLTHVPDVTEGLEYRILRCARQADSFATLLHMLSTRRYTASRLRRVLLGSLLGLRKSWYRHPTYLLRVLAANPTGLSLLHRMKYTATQPILTKPAHYRRLDTAHQALFLHECQCTDVYNLCRTGIPLDELTRSPYIEPHNKNGTA
ncbi:MAG: nucleotidyltransferase family protein [Eubacteriales bacterium]